MEVEGADAVMVYGVGLATVNEQPLNMATPRVGCAGLVVQLKWPPSAARVRFVEESNATTLPNASCSSTVTGNALPASTSLGGGIEYTSLTAAPAGTVVVAVAAVSESEALDAVMLYGVALAVVNEQPLNVAVPSVSTAGLVVQLNPPPPLSAASLSAVVESDETTLPLASSS
jgi:hypothetical protein